VPFLALAAFAVLGALILHLNGVNTLARFSGGLPPIAAVGFIMLAGFFADKQLRRTRLSIIAPALPFSSRLAACLALLMLSAAVTLADLLWHFPADINLALPWSLLYYPVIAAVAIVVFNLAPLAAGSLALQTIAPNAHTNGLYAIALLVALIEPALQASWAVSLGPELIIFTFIQVFAFNLVSIWLYAKGGAGSLFLFRLGYYAWWHILWPVLRQP
jgi:hypothetical protein